MTKETNRTKLAIHGRSGGFSARWVDYCKEQQIQYKIVNCYDSNIINQLHDCFGLMWHWGHEDYRAQNFARQLIFSLEKLGIKTFPSFNTCYHYDDKIGQKYLLEAINAPLVPTYVFYDKKNAINWIEKTSFPKVFKLKGGASSLNVVLVKTKKHAKKLVKQSFRKGFPLASRKANTMQRWWIVKRDKNIKALIHLSKGLIRHIIPKKDLKLLPRQKGYVYFQDFVPDNDFDDRVVVIGSRAIAIRRYNRNNDFRASGSGLIYHNPELFPEQTIETAFRVAHKLNAQSMAFDFVYDQNGSPFIIEISYAYAQGVAYDNCPGYWDDRLVWHKDEVNPQRYIIEDLLIK